MPVTVTLPDPVVDAITERRASEPLFDQLCQLIDHGFHYGTATAVTTGCITCGDVHDAPYAEYECPEK